MFGKKSGKKPKPDPRIVSRLEYIKQLCDDAGAAAHNGHDQVYGDAISQMRRLVEELLHEVPLPSFGVDHKSI